MRCRAWFFIVITCLSVSVLAAETWMHDAARDKEALQRSLGEEKPEWMEQKKGEGNPFLHGEKKQALEGIRQHSKSYSDAILEQTRDLVDALPQPEHHLYVFISSTMSRVTIKQYIDDAKPWMEKGWNIHFVLRGLIPGKTTITDAIAYMHTLIRETGEDIVPNVQLNPNLFKQMDINVVPTLVYQQHNTRVVSIKGTSVGYFIQKIKQDREGDLGKMGETFAIAERDLIEEMKARFAAIDLKEKKRQALKRIWNHVEFVELPHATSNSTRTVSADLHIDQDITGDGKLIAKKGDVINQLQMVPFKKRMIVFDGLSAKHIAKVQELISATDVKRFEEIILLTTRINKETMNGFDGFNHLQKQFKHPVYLLNSAISRRFELQAVPAIITADNTEHHFVIEEFLL